MTRATAMEIIREAANRRGFEFVQNGDYVSITEGLNWSEQWVNFTVNVLKDVEWNMAEHTVTAGIEVTAATSRMGGHQTVEDLLKAADVIKRAAELVRELNELPIRYEMSFEEA